MLETALGLLGQGIGGIFAMKSANSRFNKILQHLKQVESWQRQNLATGIGNIQASKQAFENDPRRARMRSEWESLMSNPSALTDGMVSSTKQNALSGTARQVAGSSRALSADAQRRGLGNSPLAAALQGNLYAQGNRDFQDLSANIDMEAAKQRQADKERVLAGYENYVQSDLDRAYGYSKDLAGLLGSVQYGNSMALG